MSYGNEGDYGFPVGGLQLIETPRSKDTKHTGTYHNYSYTNHKNHNKIHSNKAPEPSPKQRKPIVISGYKSVYIYKPKDIYVLDFGDGSNSDDYQGLVTKAEDFFGFEEAHSENDNIRLCSDGFVYRQSKDDERIIVKCDPETDEELEVFLDASSMGVRGANVTTCIDGRYLRIGFFPCCHPPAYYYYDIYTKGQTTVPKLIFPTCSPYHGQPNDPGLPSNKFRLILVSYENWRGFVYGESYDTSLPGDRFCELVDLLNTYSYGVRSGTRSFKLDNSNYIITSLYGIYKFNIDTITLEQLYFDDTFYSTDYTMYDKYIYFTKKSVLYRYNLETNSIDKTISLPIDPTMDIVGKCGYLPYRFRLTPTKDFVLIEVSEGSYNSCGGFYQINTPIHFDTFYFLVDLKKEKVNLFFLPDENEFVGAIKDDNIIVSKREYTEETDEDEISVTIFTLYDLTTDSIIELAPVYYCNIHSSHHYSFRTCILSGLPYCNTINSDDDAIYLTGSLTRNEDDIKNYKITEVKIERELVACPVKVENYVCHIYRDNTFHLIRYSNGKTDIAEPGDDIAEPIYLNIEIPDEVGFSPFTIEIINKSKMKFSEYFIFFGDGHFVSLKELNTYSHTYRRPGRYHLVIYAYTEEGIIAEYRTTIFVSRENQIPIARCDVSSNPTYINREVEFANLSTGSFDDVLWHFGDGQLSNEFEPKHIYTTPGIYIIKLELLLKGNTVSTCSRTIQVKDLNLLKLRCSRPLELKTSIQANIKKRIVKNRIYPEPFRLNIILPYSLKVNGKVEINPEPFKLDLSLAYSLKVNGKLEIHPEPFKLGISLPYSLKINGKIEINPKPFKLKTQFLGKLSKRITKNVIFVPPFEMLMNFNGNVFLDKDIGEIPIIKLNDYDSLIVKGETVTFSVEVENNPSYIEWEIDGNTLYGSSITYTFNKGGDYVIKVSAENKVGKSSISFNILVLDKIIETSTLKYFYILYTMLNKVFIYNAITDEFYTSVGGFGSELGKFNEPTSLTVSEPT